MRVELTFLHNSLLRSDTCYPYTTKPFQFERKVLILVYEGSECGLRQEGVEDDPKWQD